MVSPEAMIEMAAEPREKKGAASQVWGGSFWLSVSEKKKYEPAPDGAGFYI